MRCSLASPFLRRDRLQVFLCQAAYDKALEDGDIHLLDVGGGRQYAAFTTFTKGKKEGKTEKHSMTGGKKVDAKSMSVLAAVFDQVDWDWKYKAADVDKLANGTVPKPVLEILDQATKSQQRLCKEAMGLIKAWQGSAKDDMLLKLKKEHSATTQNLATLQHILDFQDLVFLVSFVGRILHPRF